jgi:uncharacterized protein DUF2380
MSFDLQDDPIGLACNPTFVGWLPFRITIVKRTVVLVAVMLMAVLPVRAEPSAAAMKVAVFDFELLDTSLQGELQGPREDEHDRLIHAGDQLRQALADSGRFQVIDIAPVAVAAHNSNLQACGGCDVKLAEQIGADFAITGVVQKVSNLILNMNIYLRDVHSGKPVAVMSADLRGNTDESWSRAMSWLIRNRLLAPNYGKP